jgi:hypothetical protein
MADHIVITLDAPDEALLDAFRLNQASVGVTKGAPLGELLSRVQMSREDAASLLVENGMRRVADEIVLGILPHDRRGGCQ